VPEAEAGAEAGAGAVPLRLQELTR
jgi:hypothetical protein